MICKLLLGNSEEWSVSGYDDEGWKCIENCIGKGKYDKSIDSLLDCEILSHFLTEYYRGRAWLKKRHYGQAITNLNQVIHICEPNARICRRQTWIGKGVYDKTIAGFDKAIRLKPKKVSAWPDQAIAWNEKRKHDISIIGLNKIIRLNPKNAISWSSRGMTWLKQGKYDKAVSDCGKTIYLNRNCASVWSVYGISWFEKDKYNKSFAGFDKTFLLRSIYQHVIEDRACALKNVEWKK